VSAKPTQRFLLVMYYLLDEVWELLDFGGATALNAGGSC
jgi:hypothetical protein